MGRAMKYKFIFLKAKILTNPSNLNSELQDFHLTYLLYFAC